MISNMFFDRATLTTPTGTNMEFASGGEVVPVSIRTVRRRRGRLEEAPEIDEHDPWRVEVPVPMEAAS